MQDDSKSTQFLVRAAVGRAREHAARRILIGPDGVEVTDGLGNKIPLMIDGRPVQVDIEAASKFFDDYERWSISGWKSPTEERNIDGMPVLVERSGDGISINPKKLPRPLLNDLATAPAPEDLDLFRAACLAPDMEVRVLCDGSSRTRDVALALVSELRFQGVGVDLEMPGTPNGWHRENPPPPRRVFDEPAGEHRVVRMLGKTNIAQILSGDHKNQIIVGETPTYLNSSGLRDAIDDSTRSIVMLIVNLRDSMPVMTLHASADTRSILASLPRRDIPWLDRERQRAARNAARAGTPKTWLPTTEAVAKAFIARDRPRGYVGGKSLFFHGPVAFSSSDNNAVAAIVERKGAKPTMFFGRGARWSGDGVTSMAVGDIRTAMHDSKAFDIFPVDDLSEILTMGDDRLADFARRSRRDKDEAARPTSCSLDKAGARTWLLRRAETARKEIEAAHKVKYATGRQTGSFQRLAEVEHIRQRLANDFGLRMKPVCDLADVEARIADATSAFQERQAEIAQRKQGAPGMEPLPPTGARSYGC